MPTQRVSLLRCKCGEPIVVPQRSPTEKANVLMYQPKVKWPLIFACTNCGKLSEYSAQDVRKEAIEAPYPSSYPVALWCAEFECIHKGCGRRFAIYTKQRSNATIFEIVKAIFSAQPPPSCGCDNHLMTFPAEPIKAYRVE